MSEPAEPRYRLVRVTRINGEFDHDTTDGTFSEIADSIRNTLGLAGTAALYDKKSALETTGTIVIDAGQIQEYDRIVEVYVVSVTSAKSESDGSV